jgi:hypothetical protein
MATFHVKVVWSSGQPVKGSRVVLAFYGLGRGNTETLYTGDDGYATFNTDPGEADVIVDGSTRQSRVRVDGGKTVTVTI